MQKKELLLLQLAYWWPTDFIEKVIWETEKSVELYIHLNIHLCKSPVQTKSVSTELNDLYQLGISWMN